MKLFISLILVFLSFILAFLTASELRKNLRSSELLFKLSEKLKKNLSGEMCSAYKLCEAFLNENYQKNVSFSSSEDLISYINEEFSALPYISEYSETLSKFPILSSDELSGYSEKLINVAEKGYKDSLERYKKDSKNAYILFPGIIAIFILILL